MREERNHISANKECIACDRAWNSINGRYCPAIGRYVTHDTVPPCGKES